MVMHAMQPDPSQQIQIGAHGGPWILWEPERPSARREGLQCVVDACPNLECTRADVMLTVHPIDTGLDKVEWDAEIVRQTWRSQPLPDRAPARLSVDVYRATVETAHAGKRLDSANAEDAAHAAPFVADLAARLRRLLTPSLLDRFHDELCRTRGLPVGKKVAALPEDWERGELVAWIDLWQTCRLELVEVEGRTWMAIDNHCALPGCNSCDTLIDILEFDPEQLRADHSLGQIVIKPDGDWDLGGYASGKAGMTLREVWRQLSERLGDVPQELRRRRGIIRDTIGPLVLRKLAATSRARPDAAPTPTALGAARQGRVGRNAPCPCGSGKKYKRCCGQ